MNPISRVRGWWRRRKRKATRGEVSGLVREFIYLDDVSVYSILASRKGSIATEFTESQTVSLNSDVRTSIGVGVDATHAKVNSGLQAGHVQGSQVLRKAIIQTSFKELYDIECNSLSLKPQYDQEAPKVRSIDDIERRFEQLCTEGWLVDASSLRRGNLFEVEVELEADSIFRMTSIITTLRELITDNEEMFGSDVTRRLPEMQAMAQVLDSLLAGLVPIRGRLIKYSWTTIGNRDILIHELLAAQIKCHSTFTQCPAFMVGVAQGNLFWKDIRRLLFSRSEYTAFCRLAVPGLADRWSPVKITEVLEGITPQFDDIMREFSSSAGRLLSMPRKNESITLSRESMESKAIIREYAERLTKHHEGRLDADAMEDVIDSIVFADNWWHTVDGRRTVFSRATERLDAALGKETDGEVAYRIREDVLRDAGVSSKLNEEEGITTGHGRLEFVENKERFLDSEIIAIYW